MSFTLYFYGRPGAPAFLDVVVAAQYNIDAYVYSSYSNSANKFSVNAVTANVVPVTWTQSATCFGTTYTTRTATPGQIKTTTNANTLKYVDGFFKANDTLCFQAQVSYTNGGVTTTGTAWAFQSVSAGVASSCSATTSVPRSAYNGYAS